MAIFEKTIRNKNFDKLLRKLEKEIPFAGVLLKKTEDLKLVENNRYVY